MALDLGKLIRNLATGGSTYFKDQKEAKKEQQRARDLIGENTANAQKLYDRDYGDTALRNLAADPLDVLAQRQSMDAQRGLGERYNALSQTGYTDLDRQAINQQFQQARQEEQAQRGAALSAAARRGDVSGGNALLGSLMAEQGGANRASDQATNVALEGRRRAMDAMAQYGNVQAQLGQQAGAMRAQGVNEQVQRGGAIDAFNQFGIQQRSNDAANLANANLGQAQSIQQHAQQLQSTPNLDAGVNAVANYYSMGAAGNVAGGGGAGGYQAGGSGGSGLYGGSASGTAAQAPMASGRIKGRSTPTLGAPPTALAPSGMTALDEHRAAPDAARAYYDRQKAAAASRRNGPNGTRLA